MRIHHHLRPSAASARSANRTGRRSRRARTIGAGLACTTLLLAACGGDDDATDAAVATTISETTDVATDSTASAGTDATVPTGTEPEGTEPAATEPAGTEPDVAAGEGGGVDTDLSSQEDCVALQADFPDFVGRTFNVALAVGTPGLSMVDESTGDYVGANPDLVRSLTSCLGGDAEMTTVAFDGIVPAIGAGRFDFAAASMYDTPERREVVTYIDYISVSVSGVVPPGNPDGVEDWDDACGLSTGAATGSQEILFLEAHSAACEAKGLEPISIDIFTDANGVYQALVAGRLDFAYNGGSSIAGFLSQYPDYERVFTPVPGKVEGFQFDKEQEELINGFFEATKILQSSGTQQAIIDSWGLENDTLLHPAEIGSDPAVPVTPAPTTTAAG
jgi:polar amino acid transport system substrate-binding protein